MSDDNTNQPKTPPTPPATNPPVEPPVPPKATEQNPVNNDDNVNTIITELEKDMLATKEKNYNEFKSKFDNEYNAKFENKDQEIAALKEQIENIDTAHKDAQKEVIDKFKEEINTKFSNIEGELSTRKSKVPDSENPFRKENSKFKGDWFENPDLTAEEKSKMFIQYVSGK